MQVYLKVISKSYRNLLLSSIIKDHPKRDYKYSLKREQVYLCWFIMETRLIKGRIQQIER